MCENSCRFLGASTTEDNQRHSKPAAENKSFDEGQGVANMICKLFQQQGATEVEVDKFSGNPFEYQYFSTMFKEVVDLWRSVVDRWSRSVNEFMMKNW